MQCETLLGLASRNKKFGKCIINSIRYNVIHITGLYIANHAVRLVRF